MGEEYLKLPLRTANDHPSITVVEIPLRIWLRLDSLELLGGHDLVQTRQGRRRVRALHVCEKACENGDHMYIPLINAGQQSRTATKFDHLRKLGAI